MNITIIIVVAVTLVLAAITFFLPRNNSQKIEKKIIITKEGSGEPKHESQVLNGLKFGFGFGIGFSIFVILASTIFAAFVGTAMKTMMNNYFGI